MKYKNLEIVENPIGKAGLALTSNFKYIADKIDEYDIDQLNQDIEDKEIIYNDAENDITSIENTIIFDPITLYCSPTGNDETGDGSESNPWYSLEGVFNYLLDRRFSSSVDIIFKNGHYNFSNTLEYHSDGLNFNIKGETDGGAEITAVSYISGEEYARVYDITVDDAHGAVVGDYISIYNPRGGTNPERLAGYHEITSVTGNTLRILAKVFGDTTSSGAITSDVVIHRTIIEGDLLRFNDIEINSIENIGFNHGNMYFYYRASANISKCGIRFLILADSAKVFLNQCGGNMIQCVRFAYLNADYIGFARTNDGSVVASQDSRITIDNSTFNGDVGFNTSFNENLDLSNSHIMGNRPIYLRYISNGSLNSCHLFASASYGILSDFNTKLTLRDSTIEGATDWALFGLRNVRARLRDSTIKDSNNGVRALTISETYMSGVTFQNITSSNTNPTLHTRAQGESFIAAD